MATVYEQCDESVEKMATKVIEKFHGALSQCEVTIGYYFIERVPKTKQPALKLHGVPALAVIRINPYKERVQGKPDATVVIDRDWWNDAHDNERMALLDHELTHLVIQYDDETNSPKSDDLGRPKLKMRPHDHELGIFKEVIQRHGDAAPDAKISQKFVDDMGQFLMDFAATG